MAPRASKREMAFALWEEERVKNDPVTKPRFSSFVSLCKLRSCASRLLLSFFIPNRGLAWKITNENDGMLNDSTCESQNTVDTITCLPVPSVGAYEPHSR
jgi:hypothetical protein